MCQSDKRLSAEAFMNRKEFCTVHVTPRSRVEPLLLPSVPPFFLNEPLVSKLNIHSFKGELPCFTDLLLSGGQLQVIKWECDVGGVDSGSAPRRILVIRINEENRELRCSSIPVLRVI